MSDRSAAGDAPPGPPSSPGAGPQAGPADIDPPPGRLEADRQRQALQSELAIRELEAFAHTVSHDLRAPLRIVEGFATILLEDHGHQLDEIGRAHVGRILAAGRRMNGMIDALLQLSRTTGHELAREPVDLSRLAQEIAEEIAAGDRGRRVQWCIAPGLRAEGDRALLAQVLQNLMGNAFKFTAGVAAPSIEFDRRREDGRDVFHVRDNGAGFDMRYAARLFGAFQRLHSPSQFPGTGIGLATVQRIVRRHGGRVWAEAAPGAGATFYFTLA